MPLFRVPGRRSLMFIAIGLYVTAIALIWILRSGTGEPATALGRTALETDAAAQNWARRQITDALPSFRLPDLDGHPRDSEEWQGRLLVINVWATWCAPCREEVPLLIDLQNQYDPKVLTVLGLSLDDPAPVARFAEDFGINYPLLVGSDEVREVTRQFGSDQLGLPHTFFVDTEGTIVDFHLGLITPEQMERLIERLVE
ncbi:MAG: TlpA family protein disulfide reductase [Natronospirillum sp.]|uniref:TlpA family protein disulfide reductase n=1 Tax=Natronospirillum sp. TaxID=2812955 RepID=UPI0025F21E1E|nr:TlpA disulfide reductase family protein [Natronospirillum sp.]MCH8552782.1 TlpA family protein disulfide reductase [Natronospirillum sp.]